MRRLFLLVLVIVATLATVATVATSKTLEPLSTDDINSIIETINNFGDWATGNGDDSLFAKSVFEDHGIVISDVWYPDYSFPQLMKSNELIRCFAGEDVFQYSTTSEHFIDYVPICFQMRGFAMESLVFVDGEKSISRFWGGSSGDNLIVHPKSYPMPDSWYRSEPWESQPPYYVSSYITPRENTDRIDFVWGKNKLVDYEDIVSLQLCDKNNTGFGVLVMQRKNLWRIVAIQCFAD
jgi:hypothetical protein